MADQQEARAAAAAADAEMVEAASSGSDSSDSDDFEELEVSPEDAKALAKLEGALEANPNLYDAHVQARPFADCCCRAVAAAAGSAALGVQPWASSRGYFAGSAGAH